MAWHEWFTPHKETHNKAHLLSWHGLVIYILFFILLQVSFSIISYTKPGVLGLDSNIDQKRLIELTNIERQKKGLSSVSENKTLDQAALLKAQNMFEENYWAHFAPSGKSPWDFMLGSGYRFTFAGENLAKNFYNSEDVVVAWMNSPTHRDNLLNPKYKDIGIAISEGVLNGQKTTIVVQMFGTTNALAVNPSVEVQGKQIEVPKKDLVNPPSMVAAAEAKPKITPLIDPFKMYKYTGFSVIAFMLVLLALDVWMIKRRGVFRLSSHNVAHMSFLSLTAGSLFVSKPGSVLGENTLVGSNPIFNFNITSMNILIIGILVYLIWALIHHKRDRSLTFSILVEYLLTAAFSLILVVGAVT